ncbi:hypothetical protein BJ546DRAFT_136672 [Cryomyces antarcticus]
MQYMCSSHLLRWRGRRRRRRRRRRKPSFVAHSVTKPLGRSIQEVTSHKQVDSNRPSLLQRPQSTKACLAARRSIRRYVAAKCPDGRRRKVVPSVCLCHARGVSSANCCSACAFDPPFVPSPSLLPSPFPTFYPICNINTPSASRPPSNSLIAFFVRHSLRTGITSQNHTTSRGDSLIDSCATSMILQSGMHQNTTISLTTQI